MIRNATIFLLLITAAVSGASAGSPGRSLVYIDQRTDGDSEILLNAGLTVIHDAGDFLLAIADGEGLRVLQRMGIAGAVIDEDVAGKHYYTVYPVRAAADDDPARYGRVLRRLGPGAIIETSPDQAERLAGAGYDIVRIVARPIRPTPRTWRSPIDRAPAQADPVIQSLVDSVDGAEIDAVVERLQDFVTRWALHDSCEAAATWISDRFRSFGIDSVYYQNFSAIYKDNVVAVMPGKSLPDEIIVIGGHYDSSSNNAYVAPGADDNASGTACVLECARVLSAHEFDRTIIFIAFGAEEMGLLGSEHFAAQAATAGDNIVAMINVDMIGYVEPGDVLDLDVVKNEPSTWLRDRVMDVAALYVPDLAMVDGSIPVGSGSDHISFWDNGYHAIMFFEDTDQHSPYIHTMADSIGPSYNSPLLAERSIRAAVALLADLANPVPSSVFDRPPAPPAVSLEQNRPNPFNPSTMIQFTVPSPGERVALTIFDVAGATVRMLVDDQFVSGTSFVWWDGRNDRGEAVSSGVYFCRLRAGATVLTRKLVLVR